MSDAETTKLDSRLWMAERELDSVRGMFAGFAAVVTGSILIGALFTPFTASTDADENSVAGMGETFYAMLRRSGSENLGLKENFVLIETATASVVVVLAIIVLLFIGFRAIISWGKIVVRVIGGVLLVTVLTTYGALTVILGTADGALREGPAIWLLVLGAILFGILAFAKGSAELWGSERRRP